ncbi:hypothetical protein R1sor_020838 [Riccia sorocarpa]|uniref:U-box domain-containing protein n=1 Tax=Riccia sorocarpa TaxID=122646 RepID=A0ABD3GFB6_9MARC
MAAGFVGLGNVITELQDGITQLKKHLLDVKEMSNYSRKLADEVTLFTKTLDTNLEFLTTHLPATASRKALGSLINELEAANKFMADALEQKKFKSAWSVKEAKGKLESRRQKLASSFQLAFIITSLDGAFVGHRKTNDFQERLQEVYSVHTFDSAVARTQIQELLEPLVCRIRGQDEKLKTVLRYVEDGVRQNNAAESTDVQKFFADVLAAVDELQNDYYLEELMYDPIYTDNLMWDPVKASDGFTYDRWTIVEHGDHPDPNHRSILDGRSPFTRAPLSILCDDVTVRQRLYTIQKFRKEEAERKSTEMRKLYRMKTLELVTEGHDGEALERLEHVLKWAPGDEECQKHRDIISDRLKKSESSTKSADESIQTMIEDLQRRSQYDAKLQLLEMENMELKASLSATKSKSEAKVQLLEMENMELKASLSATKSKSEAKVFSLEGEIGRLTVKLDELRFDSQLDKERISMLEKCRGNISMEIFEAVVEASRHEFEQQEVKLQLLEKEKMDLVAYLSALHGFFNNIDTGDEITVMGLWRDQECHE